MKTLVVCSLTSGNLSPFIEEQCNSLIKNNIHIDYLFIKEKGIIGYYRAHKELVQKLKEVKYDLIHAHYGLCGFISVFQNKVPVITTFHGSDINYKWLRIISLIVLIKSKHCIFVSEKLKVLMPKTKNSSVIPCGVNIDVFKPMDKEYAKAKLDNIKLNKFVLFSSSFDNKIKNYKLASQVVSSFQELTLVELKNKGREEVNLYLNSCEFLILTSFNEGSPQIIKEAMACNCPIVSVDVGDIKERLYNVNNCYITSFNTRELVSNIKILLKSSSRSNGRSELLKQNLDLNSISLRIIYIYKKCVA